MTSTGGSQAGEGATASEDISTTQGQKRCHSAESGEGGGNPLESDESLQPPLPKRSNTHGSVGSDEESSSEVELDSPVRECGSGQTVKSTKWALNHFNRWKEERNERFAGDTENQIPPDLLKTSDPQLLCKWLGVYAAEARKQDGRMFPPNTVYNLLAGLVRYMRVVNPSCPNFLHTCNLQFKSLHDSLDETFRKLKAEKSLVRATPQPFTKEEEEQLWSSGALSTSNPKGLLHAVFFLNSRNFGLCGGRKHRQLKLSQFKRIAYPPRYVYTYTQEPVVTIEPGTYTASLKRKSSSSQNNPSTPVEKMMAVDAAMHKGNRCHVHVLDLYLKELPAEAFEKDNFYVQPASDTQKHWYLSIPMGKHTLSKMVRDICKDAGVSGERTLRAGFASGHAGVQDNVPLITPIQVTPLPIPQFTLPPLPYLMQGTVHPAAVNQPVRLLQNFLATQAQNALQILSAAQPSQSTTTISATSPTTQGGHATSQQPKPATSRSTNPRPTSIPTLGGAAGPKLLPKVPQNQQPATAEGATNHQLVTMPTPTCHLRLPLLATNHSATNQQPATVQAPTLPPLLQQLATAQCPTSQQSATTPTPIVQLPLQVPQNQPPPTAATPRPPTQIQPHTTATAGPKTHLPPPATTTAGSQAQKQQSASITGGPKAQIQQPATTTTSGSSAQSATAAARQPSVTSQQQTVPQSPITFPQGYNPLRAIPQQLSFTNCHVTIYVTPHLPPRI